MARLRYENVAGTLTSDLEAGVTTLSHPNLARMGTVAAPDVAAITIIATDGLTHEVVHVTSHTDGATTATISRGQEGTTALAFGAGAVWTHGPTGADFAELGTNLTVTADTEPDPVFDSHAALAVDYRPSILVDGEYHDAAFIYCRPSLDQTVSRLTGLRISGAPAGTQPPDEQIGAYLHWDAAVGITTPLCLGVMSHVGVVGGVITEARAFVAEIQQLFGTVTKGVGFFLADGKNAATDPWAFQTGDYKSQHRGPLAVGGATVDTAPATSASVDLQHTDRALILNRVTTTQRNALTAVEGMVVYNTTTDQVETYADSAWRHVVDAGGATFTGTVTLSDGSPAASQAYAAGLSTGIVWASACAVAATSNVASLSGEQTIDGVLTSTSRVLLTGQSTTSQNGIYVTAAGAWSRATDMDQTGEFVGKWVPVSAGTSNSGIWRCTNTAAPTVGSDPIGFEKLPIASLSADGTTITLTGSTLSRSALTGDVTASAGSAATTVTAWRGRTVHNATPVHGDIYAYDAVNTRWSLDKPLGAVVCRPPTGTAATDEANFIAACDEAISAGTKRVWLSDGTYIFDSTVTLTTTYNGLTVEGPRTAEIKASAVTINPLKIEADDVTLQGFTLDGADTITPGTGDRAASAANLLILQECERVTVRDVWLEYAGNNAITLNSASRCRIVDNTIWQSGGTAISGQANLASCEDNVIRGNLIVRTERVGDDGYTGGGIKMMGHQVGQGGQATYGGCLTDDTISTFTNSSRTTPGNHGKSTGDPVYVAVETGSAGIVSGRRYYVVVIDADTFKLAPTYADAIAGTNLVNITSTGNVKLGYNTQRRLKIIDNTIVQPYIYGGLTITGCTATAGGVFTKTSHGLPASGRTECRVHTFAGGFSGPTDTTTVYYARRITDDTFDIYTASSGGSAVATSGAGTCSLTTVPGEGSGGNEGVVIQEPSAIGAVVSGNTTVGCTIGISLSTCQSPSVSGNTVTGFSKFGFEYAGVQDFTCTGNTVDGMQAELSDSIGASAVSGTSHLGIVAWPEDSVRSSYRGTIVGNSVRGLRPMTQANMISKGIVVQDPDGRDMQIVVADNTIAVAGYSSVGSYGIHLNKAWGVNVHDNQIDGGELGGTAQEGIRIQGATGDSFVGVFVRDNQFRNLNTGIRFNCSSGQTPDFSDSEISRNIFHSSVSTVLTDDVGWTYTSRARFVGNYGSATAATDEDPMVNT
jgi:nitrous oxidase accessory protein NosD